MTTGTKEDPKDTVEVPVETLERLQRQLLLTNRIHYGESLGRGVGQITGQLVCGIFDPITGLSQSAKFFEGICRGVDKGVQTSRLIYEEARYSSGRNKIRHLESRLKKLRERQEAAVHTDLTAEEVEEMGKNLATLGI